MQSATEKIICAFNGFSGKIQFLGEKKGINLLSQQLDWVATNSP